MRLNKVNTAALQKRQHSQIFIFYSLAFSENCFITRHVGGEPLLTRSGRQAFIKRWYASSSLAETQQKHFGEISKRLIKLTKRIYYHTSFLPIFLDLHEALAYDSHMNTIFEQKPALYWLLLSLKVRLKSQCVTGTESGFWKEKNRICQIKASADFYTRNKVSNNSLSFSCQQASRAYARCTYVVHAKELTPQRLS